MAFAHGLFGAVGKNKTTGSNRSRKAPALLAVLGGLGAAGAAAFKRRQSTQDQPQAAPSEPAGEPTYPHEAPPAASA
jgi:hypothetical protein